LNPDPKDVLTDEQYSEIAQEYMQKLGYGDHPYIVYKHEDIDRHHLHIVSVRVDENGKKLDHNFEYRKSMEICRKLEQDYNLVAADKKDQQGELSIKRIQYGEENLKAHIANVIRPLVKSYQFQSFGEYKAILSLYNIIVEEIKGGVEGKQYNGLVYSATDNHGERIGKPFKSSLFGKSVGYDALQQQMLQSAEIIKEKQLKRRTKAIVTKAMQLPLSRANFEKYLAANSINVVFRLNDAGRIYGVTFIDQQNKCALNGSRLGKDFSANVFNELFPSSKGDNDIRLQQQSSNNIGYADEPDFRSQRGVDNSDTSLNIFSMETNNGTDSEEEAFIRRMRKKKRRRI
jgi:hypothetical protein